LDSQSRVFEYNSGERTVTQAVEPETNNESKIDVDDILEKLL